MNQGEVTQADIDALANQLKSACQQWHPPQRLSALPGHEIAGKEIETCLFATNPYGVLRLEMVIDITVTLGVVGILLVMFWIFWKTRGN